MKIDYCVCGNFHSMTQTKVTIHSPHLRSGELCSTFFRSEGLHKLFGFLLHRRFVSAPTQFIFIYAIIYLCHYGLIDLILYVIMQYYFILLIFCCSDCSTFSLCSSYTWILYLFEMTLSLWFSFFISDHFF